ncbi:MAG: outer membrane beta-barrel protein [Verrucomicrobiales bacterium]|nr:outer membrane beta-barrel protein [Verrucomicrobiales bacterium]
MPFLTSASQSRDEGRGIAPESRRRRRGWAGGWRWWSAATARCAAVVTGSEARGEWDSEKYLSFALGPVSLRPQLEVAEVYDSNLFYSETDQVEDFVTVVRPGMVLFLGNRDEDFVSLRYTLDASYYSERDDLNNLGHSITHSTRYRLARTTLQAEDRLTLTRMLLGGTFSYIQRRIGQVSLSDNWRVDYDISPRTVVGVRATLDYTDYDEKDLDPFHLYDNLSYSGGMRVGYRPSDKIMLFPEVMAGQSLLERNRAAVPEAPNLNQYSFSIGAEGEFTPKISGQVSGGYEIRNYEDEREVPDGWIAGLQLRWQARAKTRVTLGYRHWIQVSRENLGLVYNAHRPTVSVLQQFGSQGRWSANLDGYYQFHAYDGLVVVGGRSIERDETLAGLALRASYRWQPWLLLSAQYDFFTYEGNLPTVPNYDVHRFTLRMAAGY